MSRTRFEVGCRPLASEAASLRGRTLDTPVRLGEEPAVVRSLPLPVSERRGWVTTGRRSRPAEPVPLDVLLPRSSESPERDRALAGIVLARPDGAGGTERVVTFTVSRCRTRVSPVANDRPGLVPRGRTLADGLPFRPPNARARASADEATRLGGTRGGRVTTAARRASSLT
jgi:hypothetical protein